MVFNCLIIIDTDQSISKITCNYLITCLVKKIFFCIRVRIIFQSWNSLKTIVNCQAKNENYKKIWNIYKKRNLITTNLDSTLALFQKCNASAMLNIKKLNKEKSGRRLNHQREQSIMNQISTINNDNDMGPRSLLLKCLHFK